jgi:hypothetical protein
MDSRDIYKTAKRNLDAHQFNAFTTRSSNRGLEHPDDQRMSGSKQFAFVRLMNNLIYLGTASILSATVYAIAIFLAIAIVVVLLFEKTTIANIIVNRDLTAALSLPTVTIAFIYRSWQDAALRRYVLMPAIYFKMQCILTKISDTLADGCKPYANERIDRTEGIKALKGVFHLMMQTNVLMHKMFTGNNAKIVDEVSPELVNYINTWESAPKGPEQRIDIVTALCRRYLSQCDEQSILYTDVRSSVIDGLAELRRLKDKATAIRVVATPSIFYTHQILVVVVYLVFLLPVQMYQQVDLLTLFTFPVVMILLMGPWLLNYFIGGPFSKNSRNHGMDFDMWYSTTAAHIILARNRAAFHMAEHLPVAKVLQTKTVRRRKK